MDRKRIRKNAAYVSKRHMNRLIAHESENICTAILNSIATLHNNAQCKSAEDLQTHMEKTSTDYSSVANNQVSENGLTEDYYFDCERNENDNLFNKVHKFVNDLCQSETHLVSHNENMTEDSIKIILAIWAVQHQISHKAVTALLQSLRHHSCFSSLPLDARSLVKTPRNQEIRMVAPGTYCHFGLKRSVLNILTAIKENVDSINIAINIDGLPLSKSSKQQFWPILGSILPYSNVFAIGIYYGHEKPEDINNFLKDFVNEATEMCKNGIYFNGRNIRCRIKALICDTPAKAFVLCVKGHTGYSSCTKCTTEGEYIGSRLCFPEIDAPLRSDDDFIQKVDDSYHKTNITCSLLEIPHFKPVSNVPLDYMHLVCLGIMRKLIYLWLDGDFYYRLQHRAIAEISTRLTTEIKPSIPTEFARKPRKIEDVKLWKATEFKLILLYTGPLAFKGILKRSVYIHFMTLHVIIRILSSKNVSDEHLYYVQDMIRVFIKTFIKLYKVQNVSHNVHSLIHLVNDVRQFGSLDNFSAFKFENYMQVLKKYVRKPDKPLEQIVRRYIEEEINLSTSSTDLSDSVRIHNNLMSLHTDGPLLPHCNNPQYKAVKCNGLTFKAKTLADSCCGLNCGAIVCIENVAYCTKRNIPVIIGYQFLDKEDLFTTPCHSSLLGIYSVKLCSDLKSWSLKDVIKKYVKFPHGNSTYAVFPLIHS